MNADDHHAVDCNKVVAELYTYLDQVRRLGEPLTAEQQAHIQHHLDACSPCLEALDFEFEFLQMVRVRCVEQPPPQLADRIRSALRMPLDPPGLGGIPTL